MNFLIMNKDRICGKWINHKFTVIDKSKLPIYLQMTGNVEKWLEIRAIDYHRANSRLLKKALRLTMRDDINTVISVNAVTITDNFWVKPLDGDIKYSEVRFNNDYFATLALTGSYDSFNNAANSKNSKTPELTNIGSFEKCWKLVDNEWWMYKRANYEELFSELFIYRLGIKLGFNMAVYERGEGIIRTKDFTCDAKYNFEPTYSFMGDTEDYIETVKYFDSLKVQEDIKEKIISDYVRMLFLDTICANPDRHTFNYGLLTDGETNEVIGLAPNFDNNMALISRGYPQNIERKNDLLVRLFNELMLYDVKLKRYIPDINAEMLKEVLTDLDMSVEPKTVIDFIMNGYKQIEQ